LRRFAKFNIINNISPLSAYCIVTGASGRSKINFLSEGKLMNKLIAALIAGAFALGSVAAMAADEDNPAYKMGMASQRQHDLELIEGQATNQPPTTAAESKELRDAAAKARAAYATMTPEQKAMYKKGMKAQRQMDLQAQEALAQPNPPITPEQQKAINAHKSDTKALPTAADKQKALKEAEKNAGPGS
jgi:hypothetical protein